MAQCSSRSRLMSCGGRLDQRACRVQEATQKALDWPVSVTLADSAGQPRAAAPYRPERSWARADALARVRQWTGAGCGVLPWWRVLRVACGAACTVSARHG